MASTTEPWTSGMACQLRSARGSHPGPRRLGRDGIGGRRRPRRADRPRGVDRRHPGGCRARPARPTRCTRSSRPGRRRRPRVAGAGPRRHRRRAQRDLHAAQRARHRRGDRRGRPPRRPRLVLPGDAPAARAACGRGGGRLPDRPRLRRRARPDQRPGEARRRPARHGRRDPDVLVHHPSDVDVTGDRRDPLRRQHRDVDRVGGRPAGRIPLVQRRGALRLPGAVRRAGGPPRPPPRAA